MNSFEAQPINGTNGSGDERERLLAEIAAAKDRLDRAHHDGEARAAEAREALRSEVMATRDTLAEMERQLRQAMAMIQDETAAEVERILAEARKFAAG